MENKCPKCGAKLSVFYLKPECPKCGCNIMNYNMEDSLIVKNGHTPSGRRQGGGRVGQGGKVAGQIQKEKESK